MTDTRNLRVSFGVHEGEKYTRVPIQFLKWMISVNHSCASIAKSEYERRNYVEPTMDITAHAIDNVSMFCLDIWRQTRKNQQEGLHGWLMRVAAEAYETDPLRTDKNVHRYLGMRFVFKKGLVWPVLITVRAIN